MLQIIPMLARPLADYWTQQQLWLLSRHYSMSCGIQSTDLNGQILLRLTLFKNQDKKEFTEQISSLSLSCERPQKRRLKKYRSVRTVPYRYRFIAARRSCTDGSVRDPDHNFFSFSEQTKTHNLALLQAQEKGKLMHCCVESFECLLVKFRSYFLLNRIRGLIDLPSSSKGNCLAAKKRSKFCFVVCFWGRDLQGCLGIMMADFISALLVHNEQAELWPPETFLISRLGTSRTFEKQHRHTVQASFFGQKVKQQANQEIHFHLLYFHIYSVLQLWKSHCRREVAWSWVNQVYWWIIGCDAKFVGKILVKISTTVHAWACLVAVKPKTSWLKLCYAPLQIDWAVSQNFQLCCSGST